MGERVGIAGQGFDDSLLVLVLVAYVVSTILAVAMLSTEHFLLETVAVEFQAPRTLAVAANLNLLLHLPLLVIHLRNYYYVA